jgi:hypothetical protein
MARLLSLSLFSFSRYPSYSPEGPGNFILFYFILFYYILFFRIWRQNFQPELASVEAIL